MMEPLLAIGVPTPASLEVRGRLARTGASTKLHLHLLIETAVELVK